jgi:hypothetical protein
MTTRLRPRQPEGRDVVERFASAPIELPARGDLFQRADLIFYGIDHSGPSFEAQVFFDPRGVSRGADEDHRAYVGSFFIFGHGGCFGDRGHCDIPTDRDPFDLRPRTSSSRQPEFSP